MILKSSLYYINEFFFYIIDKIRKIYLSSNLYNKKISKIDHKSLEYKPSPNLLDCLIKYEKKKNKIEDFYNINSLPSKLDKNFLKKNSNKIVKYMVNDKKNTGDRISLILLKKIGKTSNPGQVKITIGEMKKILKNIN